MRHLMEKFRSHYNPEEPPEYEYQDDERLNEEDDVEFPEVVNEDDIRPNHEAYNPYENVDYLHERTIRQAHHNLVKQSYETPLGEYAQNLHYTKSEHSRTMNPNNLELHRSINRQVFKNSPRRFNARHVKDAISNATFPNYLTNQGRISNENIDVEAFPNRYTNYTTCRSERESRELLTQDDWNSQEYHSNERYPVKLQQMPPKHQYDSRNQPPWIQEERIQHQNNRRKQMPKVELPRTLQYQRNQPRRISQQEGSQHQYNSTQQSPRIEQQQQKTLQPQSDPKNQSPMIEQEVFSPNAPHKQSFQTKLTRFQYEPPKKIPLPGLKPPKEMPIHGLKEPLKQMRNSQEYHSNERYPVKLQQMPPKHQYDSRNQPPWLQEQERIQHQNNRIKQMPKVELQRKLQHQRNQPTRMAEQEGSQHQYKSKQQSPRIEQQQKTLQPQFDPRNQTPMEKHQRRLQEVFNPNTPHRESFQTKLTRFQYEPPKKMPTHGLNEAPKQMSIHGLNEPQEQMSFHPGLNKPLKQIPLHPGPDEFKNDMYSDDEAQDVDGPERILQGDSDVSDSSVDYGRFEHNFQGSTSSPL
ncbi:putative mediator of RNA polymerase II transcription subunit 26 [Diaphorina citri]|uniref:Mediator of RNA polymerase II transcription subunit 26 n=1 Tax=Diaphorina citri TaxID=121845 RepID=A0A1S3CUJ1_DIACI|nr:putative mediator of RNA polymerase II transcription subunit 26 [Diaphorina citri]